MNQFLKTLIVCVIFFLEGSYSCEQDCKDESKNCAMMKGFCSNSITKGLCRYTCQECTPCFSLRPALSTCEVGTCKDHYSPLMCFYLKRKPFGCLMFSRMCRSTCGLCQGCFLPPTEIPCTNDCKDNHGSCEYWKQQEYCLTKKGFPHVITVCPLSCGRCKPCPTPEPNTALPPTKEEAQSLRT